ncbi:MAG TPA: SulP family inorganic anion transporter [Burkholderiaceae bacterium]|nr:SulP family inorganic anion transporter [Burkholderiaceae bacterium]
MQKLRGEVFSHLVNDVPAAIVVFLVALPLCLGIALACGVPLLAGLVAGVVGGVVVGLLSGSQLSVSGPAAGLVVIVVEAIAKLGSFEAFLVALVLAGALQWMFGYIKAGEIGACFPSPVIKGMLAAIGLLLIIKQIPIAFGFASAEHALQRLSTLGDLQVFQQAADAVTEGALLVTAGALVILFAWDSPRVKRIPVLGHVPGPLLAVLWGVAYQWIVMIVEPSIALSEQQRVALPALQGSAHLWSQLPRPDWSAFARSEVYTVAITLAVVASLESLLSLEAGDRLDPLKRVAPPNRELRAQGIANIVSGFLGGLPITAVIIRTTANMNAGARTRLSAILHGLMLMCSVLFLAGVLQWIPLAALAAVLLHTGFKLAKPSIAVAAWREGPGSLVPFAVTVVAILTTNLLVGILVGLACSMLFVVHANTRGALSMTSQGDAHLLQLCKDVSFFSKSRLRDCLARVESGHALVIDASRCTFLDKDIQESLNDFLLHAAQCDIDVELRAMPRGADTLRVQPSRAANVGQAQTASAQCADANLHLAGVVAFLTRRDGRCVGAHRTGDVRPELGDQQTFHVDAGDAHAGLAPAEI